MTTVVNLHFEPCDVYIGRTIHGYQSQGWGNKAPGRTRGERVTNHMRALRSKLERDPEFVETIVQQLQGKRLGCWCAPAPCHGDNYIQILRENGYD